jgi:hypothetical protein
MQSLGHEPRHPALDDVLGITHTADGIAGDRWETNGRVSLGVICMK